MFRGRAAVSIRVDPQIQRAVCVVLFDGSDVRVVVPDNDPASAIRVATDPRLEVLSPDRRVPAARLLDLLEQRIELVNVLYCMVLVS